MIGRCTVVLAVLVAAVSATASAANNTGFYGCRGFVAKHPVALVRPHSIVVACGDGNFYLTGVRWTAWTARTAAGTATAHQNDCKPYCAAGHFHAAAAHITLSRPRSCKGARVFTELTWRYAKKSGSTTFACS